MNMPRQTPFRCLVTGASRGVGAPIVEDLASSGHRIALTARTETDLVRTASTLNVDTMVIPADVTNRAAASLTIDQVVEQLGGLDVLVINAGEGVSAPITATDDALWERMIEMNLNAPFRYVRAVVPVMKKQGFGRIVVIASVASQMGAPYISAYTAAKHGVLGLVRSGAAELARTVDSIVAKTGKERATVIATLAREQGHGKLIAPHEVAATVRFLINDSGAVNGQGLILDGGKVQA